MSDEKGIFCKDCGANWEGGESCKVCGSKSKLFKVHLSDHIVAHEKMRLKQKRKGHKRPILESESGDDLFKKTNTWTELTRIIDRLRDNYEEIITNLKTGEVKYIKEKLSEHIGHGLAKKK